MAMMAARQAARAACGWRRLSLANLNWPLPGQVRTRRTSTAQVSSEPEAEIERKFVVTAATAARLAELVAFAARQPPGRQGSSGEPTAHVSVFTDAYYDTADVALTKHDLWLRRRDAVWELKWPMPAAAAERGRAEASSGGDKAHRRDARAAAAGGLAGIDYYLESRDWPSIAAAVLEHARVRLGAPFPPGSPPDGRPGTLDAAEAYLAAHGLACFARIRTKRTRHALRLASGHRVRVDLDTVTFLDAGSAPERAATAVPSGPRRADALEHDYTVGEVELVEAGSGAAPSEALAEVFVQLGISAAPVRGKVLEFLARHRPLHYAALVDSGLVASKLGTDATVAA